MLDENQCMVAFGDHGAQNGAEEADAIATLASLFDKICSKRLRPAMGREWPRLYQAGVLRISSARYENLAGAGARAPNGCR